MVGVANDNLWRKFCKAAGLQDIVDHPDFRTNADRVAHRAATLGHVQTALAKQSVAYWYDELAKVGVPCSPINSLSQLLEHPHTVASDMVMDYEHPIAGPTRSVGQPYILNDEKRTAGMPPPLHGQHTDEILREFGFTDEDIAKFRASKVVD
jgi:crotonobetainyl-CoA:carnitine CoA-transferase CaiB-like acyl-CoA transferase